MGCNVQTPQWSTNRSSSHRAIVKNDVNSHPQIRYLLAVNHDTWFPRYKTGMRVLTSQGYCKG